MTEREAAEKLKAYAKCQSLQVKGIYEDCNNKICDNCDLCYMQGIQQGKKVLARELSSIADKHLIIRLKPEKKAQ